MRPYTPISDDLQKGSFDLMVKVYENGNASKYLGEIEEGDSVEFKHIPFNVKVRNDMVMAFSLCLMSAVTPCMPQEQYPFCKKTIIMLAAGTGITPMYQVCSCLNELNSTKPISVVRFPCDNHNVGCGLGSSEFVSRGERRHNSRNLSVRKPHGRRHTPPH